MLGVGLRKLCPQDSFGYAFRKKRTVRKSTPEGAKPARGGSKMVSGRPPDGSIGPNFAARAVRKPCLGVSGGAWGALGGSWGCLEASWAALGAVPGRSWALLGVVLGPPRG